jgi:citrate lyase subunit beta / citryl-CoA lyase
VTAVETGPAWLFVPADRPERFDKAVLSGADQIILDLEDAVPPSAKDEARNCAVRWLLDGGHGWVWVNGPTTAWFRPDLEALAGATGLEGVVVPKSDNINDPREVRSISRAPRVAALIETACGVRQTFDLADSGDVDVLMLVTIDLALDLGCDETDDSFALARSTLVLASRSACLPPPVDGVAVSFRDPVVVREVAARARALGFGGKLAIHPAQIGPLRAGFQPSEEQVAWALKILAANVEGVGGLEGEMIDKPVLARAETILRRRDAVVGTS